MPYRAMTFIDDGNAKYNAGDLVPSAGQWPTIVEEVRLGRIEPLRLSDDGTLSPVRYKAVGYLGGFGPGDVVTDATKLPMFGVLLRKRMLLPVLEDAVDPTEPRPQHHKKRGRA